MRKIVVLIVVCVSIVACKEISKAENGNDIQIAGDSLAIKDSIASSDSIDNIDWIDEELYPKSKDLPLSVLSTGVFHGDETSPEMINKGWFGVFQDRGRYYIAPTTLSIQKAFDVVLDETVDEHNSSNWTGWEVKTSHIDTSLVLISSSPRLSSHEIKTIPLDKDFIDLSEKKTFTYNGSSYTLYSTGDLKPAEYNKDEMIISNYKLYLKGYKEGKEINQLLASTPTFDDTMFRVFLIGDIDNDGFPDLVLNTSYHYNLYRPTVYLSSFADKDQLVKVVGLHSSVGC
ncbi:hypothetical protein [Dysgonomonas sp. GY617]|uniref:hypothetical protein n=1 Tax=Dysgonomonas sp. GY617 TaxID=2780420 RepID=UPI0018848C26|nr:hypothetical protein [Dysgonomonas sp. GY617]MBF0577864.1 hypothetical protein [Dysgonomonas sp. GY617]